MKNFFKNIAFVLSENKIITIMIALCITVNFYTANLQAALSNASQVFNDKYLMHQIKGFLLPENRYSYEYPEHHEVDKTLRALNKNMALLNVTMKDNNVDGTVRTICFDNTNSVGFLTFLKKCLPKLNKVLKQRNRALFLNLSGINAHITDQVITELFTLKAGASEEEQQNLIELNTIFEKQVIGLEIAASLTEDGYNDLLSHCRNLKRLEHHFYPNNNFIKIIARNCPNLESLSIKSCHNITDATIQKLAQCKKLQYVQLHECMKTTSIGIAALANNCPDLRHLDIGYSKIGNVGIRTLAARCKNLEFLNLSFCTNITDLRPLKSCQELKFLNLSSCYNLNATKIQPLAQCQNLETLILSYDITDETIQLLTQCPNLKTLNIAFCKNLTNAALQSLTTYPNLENLDISKCNQINDHNVLILAQCIKLKTLNIGIHENITGKGIFDINAYRFQNGLPDIKIIR